MIADTSPSYPQDPSPEPNKPKSGLRLQPDQHNDRLGSFFTNLSWTDRQILALHFAERLSPWEIHVVMNMSMSDVLCRIQRLKKIARQSLQAARKGRPPRLKLR